MFFVSGFLDSFPEFILLENLTWRHTMPCVLDLKMGTQQHGDDATEEKKAVKIRKCQQSTASTIGVCLSGMQVSLEPQLATASSLLAYLSTKSGENSMALSNSYKTDLPALLKRICVILELFLY